MSATIPTGTSVITYGPELVNPATWRNYTAQYSSFSMVITNETDPVYNLYQSIVDTIDGDPRFLTMEAQVVTNKYYSVTLRAKGNTWLNYFKPGTGYVSVGTITSSWKLFNFFTYGYGNSILFEMSLATINVQLLSIREVLS